MFVWQPKFVVKMLPVAKLNAEFVQREINLTKEAIIATNGEVLVTITESIKGILKCLLLYQNVCYCTK